MGVLTTMEIANERIHHIKKNYALHNKALQPQSNEI